MHLRTTFATVASLFAFVLVFGFPASGQETTGAENTSAPEAQETTTPTRQNGNIGFVSEREDDIEIFEMRPDGSGATQITHNTAVTDFLD